MKNHSIVCFWLLVLAMVATSLLSAACSGTEDEPEPRNVEQPKSGDDKDGNNDTDDAGEAKDDPEDDPDAGEETPQESREQPYITEEVTYPEYPLLKNLNFVYPSTDPFGKPVMLSGTISMSRSMTPEQRAQGFILYNHYTVFRADECPSEGMLDMQSILYRQAPNRNFITVSADYYGFGQTEDKMQAYCIVSANARASIDALLAARQLLAEQGYTWDDALLNVGYSQGGQTAIGVLKVATEEYPDLRFTRTLAGGGPYDLEDTYRQYLADGKVKMASAVVSILMAYNDYFQLGISNSDMFQGETLGHLDDWWLSKKLQSTDIDRKMREGYTGVGKLLTTPLDITKFIAPPLRDLDSDVSRRMMQALARESLCKDWSPRKDEHIFLLHHNNDDISPSVNTQHLYDFLTEQGVTDVEMQKEDFFTLGISQHISGALAFMTKVGDWIKDNYMLR